MKKINSFSLIFCFLLIFAGCVTETKKQTELETYKQEAAAKEIKHTQEMQLVVIKTQDENVALRAKIEELTEQLKVLQVELDTYKQKSAEPENSDGLEQKYNKSQADNEELRKLVQYERGLREELLKKIERDQITINELKNQLKE